MNETMFKILMHSGIYVDSNLLEKGIYATCKPILYSKNETIELMIERGKRMKDMTGANFMSEKYFENLRQCELVNVSLLVNV